ncbi:hypothetical protein [Natranaerobius thermophilus]|uniref:Uncharacterized protein n=1 Tax=Natranaerobius thermophilus (strain ATCC BAA-1301 / DSM 18059 / JW/NM-WN-LF) TaxID=457570 RepID=B2A888_NATTJ|nr:hypothetical protein [Natranaerobius thermophilus]ACB84454.1 hypothetical protein Nther_0869 [Natranaerobius thermophilus JW/NM-WN-LF]
MFGQLFLGIYFIIKGIVEFRVKKPDKPNIFISEALINSMPHEILPEYLNKLGMAHIGLGILIATMGQVEYWFDPNIEIFITTYIVLGAIFLGTIFILNKKYTGKFIIR